MNRVPLELYDRVVELALQITNATLAEDEALCQSRYETLVEFHREQTAAGREHPFLTETVADYTDDPATALRYYRQALEQANRLGTTVPTQTILLGISAKLLELGHCEQAEAHWREGRREAVRRHDEFAITEAERLEQELRAQGR